ncbi:MAG: RNA polymerase sigma factor RpoH [Desulfuromonadales bacterium]|nr:RNA polymerase sigma factor RpoH [Desulfuromonadales bacterium]
MEIAQLSLMPDTLDRYMSEINRLPLISREEETTLARRWRDHQDIDAAHQLICGHLRFVVKIANEYRSYGMRLLDLIQEGNIGLMLAVKKFDPERGIRLITYAVWWIRAYIQNFIIHSWSLVKIGTTQAQKKLFFKLSQAREAIRNLTGDADAEEIGRHLELRGSAVEEMSGRMSGRDSSLDLERFEGAEETFLDHLPDERENQEEALMRRQEEGRREETIATALAALNERERHIVHERILAEVPRTLQDVADEYGITRERVRQLEKNAMEKLRKLLAPA